ncbi:MAG: nodulation protein NfeD [Chloroflexi bacterium]|nr:nodulation protein NfeD [Chloroflexota bacterium]
MRRALSFALIAVGFGGAFLSFWMSTVEAQAPHGVVVEIDEAIQPSTARFLDRVVSEAEDGGARFVVIRLDTPGGLYDSTRDIVETILESEIPIIVFVSPSGAQAASAGTFIATAGHITAMANGTNIGAASPVDQRGDALPEPLGSKATNDAAAFLRSIAADRGRNAEALNDTVTKALAYSASEALDRDVIDFVAKDLDQLLSTIDGQAVDLFDGSSYVIDASGVDLRTIDKTFLERFLAVISNPNVAFLLLVIGAIGLFIEFLAPGLFAPGIIGVICLVMAFVAFGNLPVNWVGVGLIAFALLLMFAELKSPGVSFFGAGGVVSFVLGSVLLFGGFSFGGFTPGPIETPSFRVNYWLIGGVTVTLSGLLIFVVRDILTAQKIEERQATKGITTAALVGTTGVVSTELAPSGMVFVSGEEWSAVSDTGDSIAEGAEVVVTEVEGLTLKVYKAME